MSAKFHAPLLHTYVTLILSFFRPAPWRTRLPSFALGLKRFKSLWMEKVFERVSVREGGGIQTYFPINHISLFSPLKLKYISTFHQLIVWLFCLCYSNVLKLAYLKLHVHLNPTHPFAIWSYLEFQPLILWNSPTVFLWAENTLIWPFKPLNGC